MGLAFLTALACDFSQDVLNSILGMPSPATASGPSPMPSETATSAPLPTPTFPFPVSGGVCTGGGQLVALLVDSELRDQIHVGLQRFEADLCADGYAVVEQTLLSATPADVRQYLASLYVDSGQSLVGAMLIGDWPYAYQWVALSSSSPSRPEQGEEAISYQYYADLDGIFERSSGYTSAGGHDLSFDLHSGDTNWEIWIGVLPLYKGDYALTVEALQRYFDKNHAYRQGEYALGQGFLYISEFFTASTTDDHNQILEWMRSGAYAWTPLSTEPYAAFFFNSAQAGLSVEQGYAALSEGIADFTVADAHGTYGTHGLLDIPWVESHSLQTVYFWSNGCAVGNLDYPDNFLTSVLYSPTSLVLAAKGTTNNSGGMGSNREGFFGHNIATVIAAGGSLGEAILAHVNVPLLDPWSESREFHFATAILLGDPTLRLRGQASR